MINEIIVDTRNKWYGRLIEDESYLNGLNIDEKKWPVGDGTLNKSLYESYLKPHISKSYNNKIYNLMRDYNDEEWYLEYRNIYIDNPNNGETEFSMMWFLDINHEDGYYLPVYINRINTSSPFAFSMCGIDREDELDEEPIIWSYREFLDHIEIQHRKTMTKFFQKNNFL